MKQKIFTLLLTCMVCSSALYAARTKVGELYYNLNQYNGEAKVTYDNSTDNYPEMTSVVIPDTFTYENVHYTVTTLDDMCFQNSKSLTTVTIPNTVTEISFFAFMGCTALQSINIPAGVTTFGLGAFYGCSGLESITVDESNPKYSAPQGSNAIIETDAHKLIVGCKSTVIPDDITVIGADAFNSNSGLTSITIPASVTSIEKEAFSFCYNMTSITCLATTPPTLGEKSFYYVPKNIPVNVPQEALQSYIGAAGWDYFDVFHVEVEPDPEPEQECTGEPKTSGVCGEHLTFEIDCNDVFRVSGYGDMYDFDSVYIEHETAATWKTFRNIVKRIDLPGGLTSVGKNTFSNFTKVKSVVVPDSVTYMGYNAFGQCTHLETIHLPASLRTLDGCMFFADDALKSIAIPAATDSIGFAVTHGCFALTSITVAEGNTRYDSRDNCNAIIETETNKLIAGCKTTVIPASVEHIDWLAFSTSSIAEVNLPEGLKTIGQYALEYCDNLKQIAIPASVTYIHPEAFNGNSLTSISVAEGNLRYESPNNCNAIIEKATNTLVIGCQNSVVPEGIVALGDCAFEGEDGLKSITLPSTLTNIGWGTFYGCKYLDKLTCLAVTPPAIVADDSVMSLNPYPYPSFYQVPNGIPVYVPAESIELYRADKGWKRFTNFKAIGDEEPEYDLPSCIKESGDCGANLHWAVTCDEDSLIIYGSGSMTNFTGYGTAPWYKYAFKMTLKHIVFQGEIADIGDYAFNGLYYVESVTIPEGVTRVGKNSFASCNALKELSLPGSLRRIGSYAFSSCKNLTSFVVPSKVDTLTGDIINNSTKIASLEVRPGNTRYDSRDNCNAIIDKTTNYLIRGCANTIIPDGIERIGMSAFMTDDSIRTVTLPASIEVIDMMAFYGCTHLTTMTCLATTPPQIRDAVYTFQNVPTTLIVYVPTTSVAAYQAADVWKQFDIRPLTNMYNVKALANHGVVRGTGTYEANTTLELTAAADAGFEFSQWSDGTNANPKTLVVTQDTIIRALFYLPEVPQEVVVSSLKANEMHITWETIDAATIYVVKLYKNGALIATYNVDNQGHILDYALACPERIRARRSRAAELPASTLGIDFTGLLTGEEYSYSIDAYDATDKVVGAQSGAFVASEPSPATEVEALESNGVHIQKVLRDGQLLIIRDGEIYTATGVKM